MLIFCDCVDGHLGLWIKALNLRNNHLTSSGAKALLDIMKDINVLQLVDLRGNNENDNLLGVLEGGEHYMAFSHIWAPFWLQLEDDLGFCKIPIPKIMTKRIASHDKRKFGSKPQFKDRHQIVKPKGSAITQIKNKKNLINACPSSIIYSNEMCDIVGQLETSSQSQSLQTCPPSLFKESQNIHKIPKYKNTKTRYLGIPNSFMVKKTTSSCLHLNDDVQHPMLKSHGKPMACPSKVYSSKPKSYFVKKGSQTIDNLQNMGLQVITPWEQDNCYSAHIMSLSPRTHTSHKKNQGLLHPTPCLWNNKLYEVDVQDNDATSNEGIHKFLVEKQIKAAPANRHHQISQQPLYQQLSSISSCSPSCLQAFGALISNTKLESERKQLGKQTKVAKTNNIGVFKKSHKTYGLCKTSCEKYQQKKAKKIFYKSSKETTQPHAPSLSPQERKEIEWNNFVIEMTETLLNLKGDIIHYAINHRSRLGR
jgi:hypothetical protein